MNLRTNLDTSPGAGNLRLDAAALDPARLTAAALVSTTGAVVVSSTNSTNSKDRTAIVMASLATAMWEEAATPGEKKDEARENPYFDFDTSPD